MDIQLQRFKQPQFNFNDWQRTANSVNTFNSNPLVPIVIAIAISIAKIAVSLAFCLFSCIAISSLFTVFSKTTKLVCHIHLQWLNSLYHKIVLLNQAIPQVNSEICTSPVFKVLLNPFVINDFKAKPQVRNNNRNKNKSPSKAPKNIRQRCFNSFEASCNQQQTHKLFL